MQRGPMPQGQMSQLDQKMHQEKIRKMIDNGNPILCKCGVSTFKEGIQLIKISALDPNNDSKQDQIMHVPSLYCVKCHMPVEIK